MMHDSTIDRYNDVATLSGMGQAADVICDMLRDVEKEIDFSADEYTEFANIISWLKTRTVDQMREGYNFFARNEHYKYSSMMLEVLNSTIEFKVKDKIEAAFLLTEIYSKTGLALEKKLPSEEMKYISEFWNAVANQTLVLAQMRSNRGCF